MKYYNTSYQKSFACQIPGANNTGNTTTFDNLTPFDLEARVESDSVTQGRGYSSDKQRCSRSKALHINSSWFSQNASLNDFVYFHNHNLKYATT